MGLPEGVPAAIAARLQPEHLLEDLQIVRDGEGVAAVFMAEEIMEIVETGPGDRRHAHGAGFMGRQEDEFLRVGLRSEEHTPELQSLMRISDDVFCLKKK